ncbi:MAG: hypothetical protein M0Q13_04680 [Methanothrix sp.]|nr:hypothetical protein [Methanothrix sp.]
MPQPLRSPALLKLCDRAAFGPRGLSRMGRRARAKDIEQECYLKHIKKDAR